MRVFFPPPLSLVLDRALNRVRNSRKVVTNSADYYCAIEGGCELDQTRGVLTCFAWAVVTNGRKEGRSRTVQAWHLCT